MKKKEEKKENLKKKKREKRKSKFKMSGRGEVLEIASESLLAPKNKHRRKKKWRCPSPHRNGEKER